MANHETTTNHGLGAATGQFIARIESDDLWWPHRLAKEMSFMADSANAGVGVCRESAAATRF